MYIAFRNGQVISAAVLAYLILYGSSQTLEGINIISNFTAKVQLPMFAVRND